MGSLSYGAGSYFPLSSAATILDYGTAATEPMAFDRLVVLWSHDLVEESCPGGVHVKIVRPGSFAVGKYEIVAEAGPFFPGAGWNDFDLGEMAAEQGDILAIELTGPTLVCGSPMMTRTENLGSLVYAAGALEDEGTLEPVEAIRVPFTLAARASSGSILREAVITVAGSAAGANGSFFRTSMQISNPSRYSLAVGFAFLPAGRPGADAPINNSYEIPPYESLAIADVGTEFGVTGLGSIDVYTIQGPLPLITSRVFNDQGEAGTLGFTQEPVRVQQALTVAEEGHFNSPSDLARFRMNVGVRTLDRPAKIAVRSFNAGATEGTDFVVKEYPPHYFEQVSLQTFLGATPFPNGIVQVLVEEGAVVIYASTTDNKTNDSSVVFVKRP
jgi:hypothetical protein